MNNAKTFMMAQVRLVHVMRGWTFFVKDFGSLAPYTNAPRVVHSMANACNGVVATAGSPARNAMTAPKRDALAPMLRPLVVRSEKAFGGAWVAGVSLSLDVGVGLSGLDAERPVILRTPNTEKDVENNVKKNPATMTVAILRTYGMHDDTETNTRNQPR